MTGASGRKAWRAQGGAAYRKGIGLRSPNQAVDSYCGNASEPRDAGAGPGKSSLFFLTVQDPGIGLSGERVRWLVKHPASGVSGALATDRENRGERMIITSGRTHNRSRSPR